MNWQEDDTQSLGIVRQSIGAIAPRDGTLDRIRSLRFKEPGFDREVWKSMCGLGWPALRVPTERGGSGMGVQALCIVAEELGAGLVPEPFIACAPIAPLLPDDILTEVLSGSLIVVPATNEGLFRAGGSVQTIFADGRVRGVKKFVSIPNGTDRFLVTTNRGLVVVRRDSPGVNIQSHPTQDGGFLGDVAFEDAPGIWIDGNLKEAAEEATLATAFYLFGAMERAFDITLDYVKLRKQFGQAIGSFQAIRHRFVDLKIQLELTRAVLAEAAKTFSHLTDPIVKTAAVSRAKARTSDAAILIARESVQLHGAIGYTDASDIGLYVRKIISLYNAHGSAQQHRHQFQTLDAQSQKGLTASDEKPTRRSSSDLDTMPEEDFRIVVREWIEANYPDSLPRHPTYRPRQPQTKIWYQRLANKGWLAPAWPKELGGMGLSTTKRIIMMEEFDRFGCARFSDQGVAIVGPMLIHFGSDEQRRFFLPKILSGEHIWAQGYSEPGSGSDLASLKTEAVLDGDFWVINGQKTWTSFASDANWLHVLARTNPAAKRQDGISVFLVPTDAKGVTIREFKNLGMHDEFCEVFFDQVRLPKSAIVGAVDKGWSIAKALLEFERVFFGSIAQSSKALNRLEVLASAFGVNSDPILLNALAKLKADLVDHAALYEIYLDKARRGETLGPEVSMLKIHQTELYKRITQTALDLAGEYAAYVQPTADTAGISASAVWIQALPSTIYSGSSEIQREVVSKQVLHL